MKGVLFSIIIPFAKSTQYLHECMEYISKSSFGNYEVILLPDEKEKLYFPKTRVIPTRKTGPAEKRDIGVKQAKGEILAFIDDDAYPDRDWLENAKDIFQDENIAAVCGPGITPPSDDKFQQAGGWVNSLWFGSGGAGTYRFTPGEKRSVDDYPSMNFLVRKADFEKVGGFDTHFWPGEDTKFCHNLVYLLKKDIIYDPKVLVYHHRKPLFIPHLNQISRYALHRGHFARILPATSFRIGYLIPTFFVLFLVLGFIISLIIVTVFPLYLSIIILYIGLLTGNIFYVILKTRSISIAVITGCGIILTHVIYGLLFPVGFLKKSLKQ